MNCIAYFTRKERWHVIKIRALVIICSAFFLIERYNFISSNILAFYTIFNFIIFSLCRRPIKFLTFINLRSFAVLTSHLMLGLPVDPLLIAYYLYTIITILSLKFIITFMIIKYRPIVISDNVFFFIKNIICGASLFFKCLPCTSGLLSSWNASTQFERFQPDYQLKNVGNFLRTDQPRWQCFNKRVVHHKIWRI